METYYLTELDTDILCYIFLFYAVSISILIIGNCSLRIYTTILYLYGMLLIFSFIAHYLLGYSETILIYLLNIPSTIVYIINEFFKHVLSSEYTNKNIIEESALRIIRIFQESINKLKREQL